MTITNGSDRRDTKLGDAGQTLTLHAYALMSNHFHLGVETPRANLVEGMKWLQSTFANRFNRYRSEHGHVFQGRYHAKPLEDEFAMASVAHYIHLNPLEAGIVSIEDLGTFRDSSLWALLHPQARPPCLRVDAFLTQAGKFADTPAGHRSYLDYLRFLAADKEEQRRQAFEQACKGWAQGSEEWKRELLAQHRDTLLARHHGEADRHEALELLWEDCLQRCLKQVGCAGVDVLASSKSATWKVAVAAHMKQVSSAKNAWLARRLHMGAPEAVSRYVSELKSGVRTSDAWFSGRLSRVKV